MVLTLEKYSEKSLAVFGDIAPHKEKLLEMGGKYIANLRGRPGWIFFLNMQKTLEAFVAHASSSADAHLEQAEYCEQPNPTTKYIPPAIDRKNISRELLDIQAMMVTLQLKINAVLDLVEKTGDNVSEIPEEDVAVPMSLLRRR